MKQNYTAILNHLRVKHAMTLTELILLHLAELARLEHTLNFNITFGAVVRILTFQP